MPGSDESAAHQPHEPFRITVNEQSVAVTEHKLTGAQIKQAAIGAGVPIQQDWVLSEVRPSGEQKVVPDGTEIPLKEGDEFWAIPGDDNS